ncbi:cupin [Endozoicomonas sp. OPT23]|uniref:cupin domain-containing protein n=1 Tax=Endozoicomonas sp. OPT23 TaxID=2072845 RepID=UPI00129BBBF6|nr:cupin domain-containing protein [Endozoicomonas sp. OPT23]MRI35083.1 cupin [Endozoicomonas sp. OPT23]
MDKYIIKKDEIEGMESVEKTHFLNSNAVRHSKPLGDLTGLSGLGFHLVEVEPGYESTEFHVHQYEDECVYILQGEAEVRIGDRITRVSEGDFIGYRAGGEPHTMINSGSEILKFIVSGQRLDHDVADYPDKNKRLYRNKGQVWDLVDKDSIQTPG